MIEGSKTASAWITVATVAAPCVRPVASFCHKQDLARAPDVVNNCDMGALSLQIMTETQPIRGWMYNSHRAGAHNLLQHTPLPSLQLLQ